jgi:ribosomal protein S18 acetylase RimI-like enzyme
MLELREMTQDRFRAYLRVAVPHYAGETVIAGNVHPDQALRAAERTFDHLLAGGLDTPNQHLCTVHDGETEVGVLWFGVRDEGGRRFAALYDFWIHEPYRRQSYGARALRALEARVQALGLDEIRLHVFGHNRAARALYEKVGYRATNVTMAKKLNGG